MLSSKHLHDLTIMTSHLLHIFYPHFMDVEKEIYKFCNLPIAKLG